MDRGFALNVERNCKIQIMTDKEIISSLIAHDPKVTAQFFFKDCRPLFISVIRRIFDKQIVNYDEIISELYILLMENDAKKLRSFKFESTLYQWLKTIAIRHCLLLKNKAKVIEDESPGPLNNNQRELSSAESSQARMDMETLLRLMKNQRYALVIRLLMIEDRTPEEVARQLCVTVDNLYNIKRRAIQALTKVALKDKKHYE